MSTDAGGNPDVDSGGVVVDAGGRALSGTLCQVADLRNPAVCGEPLVGVGVTIRDTALIATSAEDGSFEILLDDSVVEGIVDVIAGSDDATYHRSVVPLVIGANGATGVSVPVMYDIDYDVLAANLSTVEPFGTGTIALYLEQRGAPAPNAFVDIPDGGSFGPLYDTDDSQTWNADTGTGALGATLLFGVPESTEVTVNATSETSQPIAITPITVIGDAITFVRTSF